MGVYTSEHLRSCKFALHVHYTEKFLNTCQIAKSCMGWWRNGSASDFRSEGCVFKSRPGHIFYIYIHFCCIKNKSQSLTKLMYKQTHMADNLSITYITVYNAPTKPCQ